MDISVPPEVAELAQRTREFVAEVVIGVEEETGGAGRPPPLTAETGPGGRVAGPARAGRVGRLRAGRARSGGGVRGGGLLAARPAGAELRGARRGEHAPALGGGHPGAAGEVPAPAGGG